MTAMESLIHTPLAEALGWTLFHSLWEGAVVAGLLVMTLSMVRSSRVRYGAACLAMLGIVAAFGFTFFRLTPEPFGKLTTVTRTIVLTPPGGQRLPDMSVNRRMADVLPWLTPFWFAGVILFHLRSIASWMSARRLRRQGACSVPDGWQQRLDQLGSRLRVTKPVALLETCLARTPVVIGCLRPVILFPIGLLAGMPVGMPVGQIEAILIHELAHIRRRDYLANLLQTAVEGFLFYHPAVWWISGMIRAERENCCDDLVVAVNGNAHEYATALTNLEENRWAANQGALAATGGVLIRRIRRLLYPQESPRAFLTPVLSAGMLAIVTALMLTAWQSKPAETSADAFQHWVNEEVTYIITDAERNAFNQLQSNEEREKFIEQFWERRNPTPGGVENAFRAEHYRRIAFANDHFPANSGIPGWKNDRGRIYITFGPPDEIDSHPAGSATMPPYEDWRYRFIEGIGNNVSMRFVDTGLNGEFHMTMDPNPQGATRRITRP
jgi:GWxTD domain-containing protein